MQENKDTLVPAVEGTDAVPRPAPHGQWVVTRAKLARSLCREIGLTHRDAASLVGAIIEEISIALIRGDTVKLSSLGTFRVKQKKLRMGRNPKTGKDVPILPRKVLGFRAGPLLMDRINHRPRSPRGKPG
jgi:integration host factor subunit alpha